MLYDKDIREPLFEFLEERYGKTRFLEEQVMGTVARRCRDGSAGGALWN